MSSCIEPYEFVIEDVSPVLVVEAYISDKSFNETLLYPSDGRHFTVRLSETGEVNNVRPVMISGATVHLVNDQNDEWQYLETDPVNNPGVYSIVNDDFKAEEDMQYQLRIKVSGVGDYESDWEGLPTVRTPGMGAIHFAEKEIQAYGIELGKEVIKTVKGITGNVNLPENDLASPIFYRWQSTPMWIYKAPLSSVSNAGHKCWVTDDNYLKDYALQMDIAGGYIKEIFFMPTVRNERIFEDFSVLITQHSMNEQHYYFWKEMQEQSAGGVIFDSPPYNLSTNFVSLTGEERVIGYFSVVREQATRSYFNTMDLSYFVPNTLLRDCTVPYLDPAEECFDCRDYSFGKATTQKPSWWR